MSQWFQVLVIAATYVGTVVGAGFATGKEIVTFFSTHGALGTLGIVVSGFLFIWVGTKVMVISARINAYSYQEFNQHIFGKRFGKVINLLVFIVVLCITSVMLSAAGAVFSEQLGLSNELGIIITLILMYAVVLKGLNALFALNSYFIPMLIIVTIFIFISNFSGQSHLLFEQMIPTQLPDNLSWISSPFIYAAFNMMSALVVLVPLGNQIQNERLLKLGGFLGGFCLFFILMTLHLILSVNTQFFANEIPMAEIVTLLGGFIHGLYLFLIYGEIFNTVVGNVFGLARQLQTTFGIRYHSGVLILSVVIFLVSQLGYGNLLTVLYPIFGYIGLIFLVFVLVRRIPEK